IARVGREVTGPRRSRRMIPIPDPSSLALFVAAALLLLVTPGPAVLYIVTRSLDQGRRAGLVSVLGVHAGTLVHLPAAAGALVPRARVAAAAAGLAAVRGAAASALRSVECLGAAYLVSLGARRLLDRSQVAEVADGRQRDLRRVFVDGVVVNVLNPKTALF